MSTTISYKGTTLATVSNNTKTLETEGKYLEADVILTDVSTGTDTSDATIQSGAQLFSGVTAYGANGKVTGSLLDFANPQLAVSGYSESGNVFLLTGASNPQNPYPFASTDGRATVAVPKALMGNAVQAQVLEPYTFSAADGIGMAGLMPDNGAVAENISTKSAHYVVPIGYHNGNGVVQIDPTEQAKIIPGNIKLGASILGVAGTYQGSQVTVSYGDLLTAVNLGAITVTSTSATNLNLSATIPGVYGYDIIIVVIRRTSKEYGHHWQTISDIHLSELTIENETSGQTNINAKQQKRYTTSGDTLTYDGTTAYGIYVNSISRTGDTLTLTIYGRYNAGFTLAIDGDYILYAYGLKYR